MHLIDEKTQQEINEQASIVNEAVKNVNFYIINELQNERNSTDRKILSDLRKVVDVQLSVQSIGREEMDKNRLQMYEFVNKYRNTNSKPNILPNTVLIRANMDTKKKLNQIPNQALRIIKYGRQMIESKKEELFNGLREYTEESNS